MDIKVLDNQGEEVKQTEMKEPEFTPVPEGEIMLHSVGQMFDLRPTEIPGFKSKINLLIDYAKSQTEDRSLEGIKWAIRSLQGKVGTPPLGEKWINYLSKYAYLKLEGIRLQQEAEQYEHNNRPI